MKWFSLALLLSIITLQGTYWYLFGKTSRTNTRTQKVPDNVNANSFSAQQLGEFLISDEFSLVSADRLKEDNMVASGTSSRIWSESSYPRPSCRGGSAPPRRVYVLRHTERLAKFLYHWHEEAIDKNGMYRRLDVNLPLVLPKRQTTWRFDDPLTMAGHIQAWLIGRYFKQTRINIKHVYSSTALRCVEAAQTLILGLGEQLEINVEHLLHEHYPKPIPFMTLGEMRAFKLNVNSFHVPIEGGEQLQNCTRPCVEGEYAVGYHVIRQITDRTKEKGGDILIMAHTEHLETYTRMMAGGTALSQEEFMKRKLSQPFGTIKVIEENCDQSNSTWQVVPPPVLPTWYVWNYPEKLFL